MTATAVAEQPDDDQPDERDLSVLLPVEGVVDVEGMPCRVRRLRAREILDLARIFAIGLGEGVGQIDLDFSDVDSLRTDLTALLLIAIPAAENETFQFLAKMLVPIDPTDAGQVGELMKNPDLGVVMDTLNMIMDQEGPALVSHLGKVQALVGQVGKLLPKTPKAKTPPAPDGTGDRSPAPST